jgi:citronellol/citronellal dehydrogenase
MRLRDRVVFITGASRGIGKACALACAKEGADIVIAAKSEAAHPTLPGTIGETAAEIERLGRRALALKLDVRDADACAAAVAEAVRELGRVDALINNAGALWWADILDTPMKKFDLVVGVNVRAAFALSQAVLPHMVRQKYGHIIMMSPPVEPQAAAHHAAYAVSKFGMTLLCHAIADEHRGENIAAHALWPATAIESLATKTFGIGDEQSWRKADILADATVAILARQPSERSGQAWIDEDLLRAEGVTDFVRYRCDPNVEPPKMTLALIPSLQGRS